MAETESPGQSVSGVQSSCAAALAAYDPPTKAELDAVETKVDAVNTDLSNATDGLGALKALIDALTTDVGTVDTVADGIQTDLSNATDGLGALKVLIDAVNTDLSNGTDGLGALKALIDTLTTNVGTVDTVVDGIQTDLSNETDGLGALKVLIDTVNTDLSNGTDGLGALKALIDTLTTAVGTVDTAVDGVQTDLSNETDGLGALKALIDALNNVSSADVNAACDTALNDYDSPTKTEMDAAIVNITKAAVTTEDLNQVAGSYDLFTGTAQDVLLSGLVIRLPNVDCSDDANITSISIQTDDTTPQVIISSTDGAKANLTAETQISWDGGEAGILIKVGTKIQLTIAGGAADAATVCDVIAVYRTTVAGGSLA